MEDAQYRCIVQYDSPTDQIVSEPALVQVHGKLIEYLELFSLGAELLTANKIV